MLTAQGQGYMKGSPLGHGIAALRAHKPCLAAAAIVYCPMHEGSDKGTTRQSESVHGSRNGIRRFEV